MDSHSLSELPVSIRTRFLSMTLLSMELTRHSTAEMTLATYAQTVEAKNERRAKSSLSCSGKKNENSA